MKDSINFTLYIPPDTNDKIEFLRYKTRQAKNTMILKALEDYLVKEIKKYPDYKGDTE